LTNELHGLLHEYGFVLPIAREKLIEEVYLILSQEETTLEDPLLRKMLVELLEELKILHEKNIQIILTKETPCFLHYFLFIESKILLLNFP